MYSVTLIAELDDGEVVFLFAPGVIPTILPPPDNFHVAKRNDSSITVQWKPPRDRNDIDRYILVLENQSVAIEAPIQITTPKTTYTFDWGSKSCSTYDHVG